MTMNIPVKRRCYLLILAAMLPLFVLTGCQPPPQDYASFIPAADKYDVRILRDTWGVPHIFGKTDADAAYGLGYAHCEDDWNYMEDAMLTARAELAAKS